MQTAEKVEPDRSALAKMVTTLLTHWNLSTEDSLELLGLTRTSRAALTRYRRGEPLAPSRDLLERVGNLLAIHQGLRRLFPHNRENAYRWMTTPNRAFDGQTPTQTVKERGFVGLVMIRGYLDKAIGQ
jgi:transcriptional regulator with XRE-family HTH domain